MEQTRRDFVKAGAVAAVAACAGCSMFIKKRDADLTLKVENGAVRIPNDKLKDALVVDIEGVEKILVFRRPDDSVHALSIACPHLGCDVEYARDRDRVECPCHGSKFDTGGKRLKGPAKENLHDFPVSREGNEIVVQVPAT